MYLLTFYLLTYLLSCHYVVGLDKVVVDE